MDSLQQTQVSLGASIESVKHSQHSMDIKLEKLLQAVGELGGQVSEKRDHSVIVSNRGPIIQSNNEASSASTRIRGSSLASPPVPRLNVEHAVALMDSGDPWGAGDREIQMVKPKMHDDGQTNQT